LRQNTLGLSSFRVPELDSLYYAGQVEQVEERADESVQDEDLALVPDQPPLAQNRVASALESEPHIVIDDGDQECEKRGVNKRCD